MALKVLPRPRKVSMRSGKLDLSGDVPLFLSPLAGGEELTAALAFAGEARERGRARLPIEKSFRPDTGGRSALFLIFGRDEKVAPELRNLPKPKGLGDEGYVIDVTARRLIAAAKAARGLFYAAQSLRQMIEVRGGKAQLPCCRIVDWPDFRYRGVMLDVSRFKVPRLDFLYEMAELFASLKINVFQLYVEHPFAWRKHPAVGKGITPLTAEEVLLLGRRCKELGIELQANQQSFGHHNHLLTRAGYSKYAEVPTGWDVDTSGVKFPWITRKRMCNWSLSPAVPATYKLIAELYDETLPLYEPELFNADCDETWDLGFGRSKKLCARKGAGRVYLEHIKKIHKLARRRGKRMMIWGDIVLDHPELIKELPKDIAVLDWAYDAQGDRNKTCRQFARAGLDFWVCPGVNSWMTIFPQTEVARVNIRRFAEAGKRWGAKGLLNTDWGDDGHTQCITGSYHGYAYGAEQSWQAGKVDDRDFDRRFSWAVFRDKSGRFGKLYSELGRTSAPFGKHRPLDYGCYPFHFLWDGFEHPRPREVRGRWSGATKAQLKACQKRARAALKLAAELRGESKDRRLLLDECVLAARETLAACRRQRVFEAACAALGGEKKLTKRQREEIAALAADWRKFRREFERVWMARSKRSQIAYRLGLFKKREKEYRKLLRAR